MYKRQLKDGDAVTSIAYVIETYGIIYNKELLTAAGYTQDDIKGFADLKKVADDIQARKAELGVDGAFTSAGMDGSSDWRFNTHLANLPIYYEYKADGKMCIRDRPRRSRSSPSFSSARASGPSELFRLISAAGRNVYIT